jgi:electron transfer flavoprotein beta subunit
MKIIVCLGHVPDTTTKVKFVENNTKFDQTGVQWVINPWDELALTRALEIKEDAGNPFNSVTVITVGDQSVEPTIRKALAIGADNGIRVDMQVADAGVTAAQVAEVIKNDPYDLIICGIESSDYNGSAVGGMLAEHLDYPSVSAVSGIKFDNGELEMNREIDGGVETISCPLPFVAIVQKGIAKEPRIPAMRGIMMARKKPLSVIPSIDADILTNFVSFSLPLAKPPCKMVDPENVGELVDLLRNEAKVL